MLPLEDVGGFQFARDGECADADAVAAMRDAVARFGESVAIDAEPGARERTKVWIEDDRRVVRAWLESRLDSASVDVDDCIRRRRGDERLFELRDRWLAERGLAAMDREFAATFISNPRSGEIVKGHAMVLAELGLCRYEGKAPRDPDLFAGVWSRELRTQHVVTRLAFTAEVWSLLGFDTLRLYRGAAVEGPLTPRPPGSFVSATFSLELAQEHFEGGSTATTAALWRQDVPLSRVLMTFLETRELNEPFREAEAILVGEPGSLAF